MTKHEQHEKHEQYKKYIQKYSILGKEPPLTIVADDNGDYWIVQLTVDQDTHELNIPKFVTGFKPLLDIVELDIETDKVTQLDKTFTKVANDMQEALSNKENNKLIDIGLRELDLESKHIMSTPLNKGTKLVINGNNIPLRGQLKGMFSFMDVSELVFKDFNGEGIESLDSAFRCGQFKQIDFSGFKSKNIQSLEKTFDECMALKEVDISNLKVKPLKSIHRMFCECHSIKHIKLPKIYMLEDGNASFAFDQCRQLISVNTQEIHQQGNISMQFMFDQCLKLEDIDISNISAQHIKLKKHFTGAFSDCDKLKRIQFKNEQNITISLNEFIDNIGNKYEPNGSWYASLMFQVNDNKVVVKL